MRLQNIVTLSGKIILKSGLHIGGGSLEMHIGGTDNPVIKHPHTQQPYIPGSSLKGKMRSLLELESGLVAVTGGQVLNPKHLEKAVDSESRQKGEAIIRFFGSSGAEQDTEGKFGPTRVSFNDCYLNAEWLEKARKNLWPMVEIKSENMINRVQGVAQHPRFTERVPEGTAFDFNISYKILADGEEDTFKALLIKGLKLVESDSLGGSGSRGYGRVIFCFDDEQVQQEFETAVLF